MEKKAHIMQLNFGLSSTAGERHATPVQSLVELHLFGLFTLSVQRH